MASNSVDRIQGLSGSLALKVPVRTVSSEALTLSGLQTVSGVSLVSGDRVLVRHQADPIDNGIYRADTGEWKRARDMNGPNDAVQGTWVQVVSGDYANLVYSLSTPGPIAPGSTPLVFDALPTFTDRFIDPSVVFLRRQTFTDSVGGVTDIPLNTPYLGTKADLIVVKNGVTQSPDTYDLPDPSVLILSTALVLGDTVDVVAFNTVVGVPEALLRYVATATSRNAVAFDLVHVTAAGTTQTLPPSPTQWDVIGFRVDSFVDTVVARSGRTIEGLPEDLTLDLAYEIRWLQWTGTSWRLIK